MRTGFAHHERGARRGAARGAEKPACARVARRVLVIARMSATTSGQPFAPRPVRARWVLQGDGTVRRTLTVQCEPKGETVYADGCKDCQRFVALRAPRPGRPGVIYCGAASDATRAEPGDLVGDLMERDVVCVREDVDADAVARLLLGRDLSAVPVIDEEGRPRGVISHTDLLRAACDIDARDPGVDGHFDWPSRVLPMPASTAADVMTPLAFSVRESTKVAAAAALMAMESVHRLPVVDVDGAVIGVLSSLDVARWVARRFGTLAPEPPAPPDLSDLADADE